ncbi:MAG: hypothetical protein KGZ30_00575 [Anaplasmataceae bacterium]|nr:hypothetical protein [Anaplasmataceae bacterium]
MTKGRLTDEMRDAILRIALEMAQKGQWRRRFRRGGICEGLITTEGKTSGVGYFFGVVYEAEVESDFGTTKIRFLVDTDFGPEDVDDSPWTERNIARDLERARTAMLN